MLTCDEIVQNYFEVNAAISKTCLQLARNPEEVKLIVVSKFHPAQSIRCLLEAGHRDFGENRMEDISQKWATLVEDYPDVRLHFLGTLQARKVRDVVKHCHFIHSLDRIKIAEKIAEECRAQNKKITCLIQVNIGAEPQKSGVLIEQFPDFLKECQNDLLSPIAGIMCIPPLHEKAAHYFKLMQALQKEYRLRELSMGMSNDYLDALNYGATFVRVGTKILGARENRP